MTRWHPLAAATALLLLGACTAEPSISRPTSAGALQARRLLAEAARKGPVRIEVHGAPASLPPQRVAQLAADGVSGLTVQFAADAPELPRLIMSFMRVDPEKLCTSPAEPERQESPARLTAAFCSADGALAGVSGTAGGPNLEDTERLVWRTTAFLLPDDYPDTYGLHLFGDWLRIGVNGSFGF